MGNTRINRGMEERKRQEKRQYQLGFRGSATIDGPYLIAL